MKTVKELKPAGRGDKRRKAIMSKIVSYKVPVKTLGGTGQKRCGPGTKAQEDTVHSRDRPEVYLGEAVNDPDGPKWVIKNCGQGVFGRMDHELGGGFGLDYQITVDRRVG